jgi:hypothetical protein
MHSQTAMKITDIIGDFPYRIALAGGWIDQPFVSQHNPKPPGSMVVIGVEPTFRWMDRCGLATSTRKVALQLWGSLPQRDPGKLVEELYASENANNPNPSGSQDMIGLIYPGASRLDYDVAHKGGLYPVHIESNNDPEIACWLERVINVLPIAPRPDGYNPGGVQNLASEWIQKLGQTGKDCYDAILAGNVKALGRSMNDCMVCWEAIMPHIVRHPTLKVDLVAILKYYQSRYPGAMYSGCGGGYLFVASEEPVPGAFRIQIRIARNGPK